MNMLAVASVCSRSKIMMAVRVIVIQATLMACWLPSSVLAFTGVHQRRMSTSTININLRDKIIQSRSRQHYPILSLGAISGDDDESEEDEDGDPLLNDQREGMADAVSVVHVYMVYKYPTSSSISSSSNHLTS